MGFTFKENCPDIRNTKNVDLVHEIKDFGANVEIYDPWVDPKEVEEEYSLEVVNEPKVNYYDAIIVAVAHNQFKEADIRISDYGNEGCLVFDLKNILKNCSLKTIKI